MSMFYSNNINFLYYLNNKVVIGLYDLCEVISDIAFPQKSFEKDLYHGFFPFTSEFFNIAGISSCTMSPHIELR